MPELAFRKVASEPLMVVLPSDHRLARQKTVEARELAKEDFIGMSDTAPVLQAVIDGYFKSAGLAIAPRHRIDNLGMAISLVVSTRGVTLLPVYARNFLPWSVTSRPLKGEAPAIDLVVGYRAADKSPLLKQFLARVDDMAAQGSAAQ